MCAPPTTLLSLHQRLHHPSVKLLKFADNTTVMRFIMKCDESAYRQEVEQLVLWCGHNNLELNKPNIVEMTVDFKRSPPTLSPLTILNSTVSAVETFRFLGTTISQDLKWASNINTIRKKTQQRLYFLLRRYNLPQELLILFYSPIIQSVLCSSITVWFGSATKQDRDRLQQVGRSADRTISSSLPSILDLYTSRVRKWAGKITADPSHLGHKLFLSLL